MIAVAETNGLWNKKQCVWNKLLRAVTWNDVRVSRRRGVQIQTLNDASRLMISGRGDVFRDRPTVSSRVHPCEIHLGQQEYTREIQVTYD